MSTMTIGIDLAGERLFVHGVDETARPYLIKPGLPRTTAGSGIAQFPSPPDRQSGVHNAPTTGRGCSGNTPHRVKSPSPQIRHGGENERHRRFALQANCLRGKKGSVTFFAVHPERMSFGFYMVFGHTHFA